MIRSAALVAALVLFTALVPSAQSSLIPGATPMLTLESPPSQYVPGQSFAVGILLSDVANLGLYNIDVVVEANVGTAGTDYGFDLVTTTTADDGYVFPSNENFFAAVNIDSPTRQRLTLSDIVRDGANTIADTNDRIASAVLYTSSSFNGILSLRFDVAGLILGTPDFPLTQVDQFETIQSAVAAANPVTLTPVPEPSALAASLVLLLVVGKSRLFRKRQR